MPRTSKSRSFRREKRPFFESLESRELFATDWGIAASTALDAGLAQHIIEPASETSDVSACMTFDAGTGSIRDKIDAGAIAEDELANQTTVGDSNNDGVFDSSDIVQAFQAGEYEDAIDGNSTLTEGDWNGDGDFDSGDFVHVFRAGTFTASALPIETIPDPTRYLACIDPIDPRAIDALIEVTNMMKLR